MSRTTCTDNATRSRPRGPAATMGAAAAAAIFSLAAFLPGPVRAEPQVHPEHPRLFLRAADIPELTKRCRELASVKDAYDERLDAAAPLPCDPLPVPPVPRP